MIHYTQLMSEKQLIIGKEPIPLTLDQLNQGVVFALNEAFRREDISVIAEGDFFVVIHPSMYFKGTGDGLISQHDWIEDAIQAAITEMIDSVLHQIGFYEGGEE